MFLNGIATVSAGNTAAVEATWMLPLAPAAVTGAAVKWEVLDSTGGTWSFGDADTVRVQSAPIGTDTHVVATAVISVPVDAPAAAAGSTYQVRWTLEFAGQTQWAMESFTVLPSVIDTQGPANAVSLYGDLVEMHLTLPTQQPSNSVRCQVYYQNTPIEEVTGVHALAPEGHRYVARLAGNYQRGPSLYPYTLIWRYGTSNNPMMEHASLWLINPTILQAQAEVRNFLVKAYADSGIDPGLDFGTDALMLHLQQGAELFNATGYPTSFTMIRASGPLRSLWLRCATIAACRSQYMSEGMKAFNFGGQVVTLDVDRSQFWDSMASNLQSEFDQIVKPFKENLVRRGILSGDGNIDANALRFGAVGAIGIAITPVTPFRGLPNGLRRR